MSAAPHHLHHASGLTGRLLSAQSDDRLLALLADGHDAAYGELLARYHTDLHCYASAFVDRSHADTIAADAMSDLFARATGGEPITDVRTELLDATHVAVLDVLDRQAAHQPADTPPVLLGAQQSVTQLARASEGMHPAVRAKLLAGALSHADAVQVADELSLDGAKARPLGRLVPLGVLRRRLHHIEPQPAAPAPAPTAAAAAAPVAPHAEEPTDEPTGGRLAATTQRLRGSSRPVKLAAAALIVLVGAVVLMLGRSDAPTAADQPVPAAAATGDVAPAPSGGDIAPAPQIPPPPDAATSAPTHDTDQDSSPSADDGTHGADDKDKGKTKGKDKASGAQTDDDASAPPAPVDDIGKDLPDASATAPAGPAADATGASTSDRRTTQRERERQAEQARRAQRRAEQARRARRAARREQARREAKAKQRAARPKTITADVTSVSGDQATLRDGNRTQMVFITNNQRQALADCARAKVTFRTVKDKPTAVKVSCSQRQQHTVTAKVLGHDGKRWTLRRGREQPITLKVSPKLARRLDACRRATVTYTVQTATAVRCIKHAPAPKPAAEPEPEPEPQQPTQRPGRPDVGTLAAQAAAAPAPAVGP